MQNAISRLLRNLVGQAPEGACMVHSFWVRDTLRRQPLSPGAPRFRPRAAATVLGNDAPCDGAVKAAGGQKIENGHAGAVAAKNGQNRVDRGTAFAP
ncbi:MAG TPA: hypothetical protein VFP59_19890 [Candidatus Angelobacter sp.]|nr:hypothetical protein [Candidatus Angelobacter sp.]